MKKLLALILAATFATSVFAVETPATDATTNNTANTAATTTTTTDATTTKQTTKKKHHAKRGTKAKKTESAGQAAS